MAEVGVAVAESEAEQGDRLVEQVPFVEEAVAEACAYNQPHGAVDEELVGPVVGAMLVLVYLLDYFPSREDGNGPQQSVPAHGQRAKVEQHGIDVPGDVV